MISRSIWLGLGGLILSNLTACSTNDTPPSFGAVAEPVVVSSHLEEAQVQFLNGNFGLAERKYKIAVEQAPGDVNAWLGLAASYDNLRRFDLADKAYERVLKLVGNTPAVQNNIGFSYLLRGDLKKAREKIYAAYKRDPDNPTILQNVERLKREIAKRAG